MNLSSIIWIARPFNADAHFFLERTFKMKVGIIGLGQSGKSSLFHTLTGQPVDTSSGRPHKRPGRALVMDDRVEHIAKNECSKKKTYAEVNFVDPVGFTPDQGKNLSSELLGMIRDSDLLVLVVRAFSAPSVAHPRESVDGMRDINICFSDMIVQDMYLFEGLLERSKKAFERGIKDLAKEIDAASKAVEALSDGQLLSEVEWTSEELEILNAYQPLTLKNGIVLWSVDEDASCGTGGVGVPEECKILCKEKGWGIEAVRLSLESEVMDLDDEDREEFSRELGLDESIRDWFPPIVYKRLGLLSFYTAGPKEAAARAIHQGETAWDAAGKIHSDIQRGFIRAEVMSFEDYCKFGSEDEVKKAGRYRVEKKEYIVQEGDIFYFRFNV